MAQQSASPTYEQVEQLVIEDVETLKVLADPLRIRLHVELEQPRTVKELATILGVPQTRLYYHVKLLERAGLIRVVTTRTVSGIEERTFLASAKSTTISPELGAALAESGAVGSMLDMVAAELEIALRGSGVVGEPDSSVLALNMGELSLRPDQVKEFQSRLFDLVSEYGERRPGARRYQTFLAVYGGADAS